MEELSSRELIVKTIKEKVCLKQDVYAITLQTFSDLKYVLQQTVKEVKKDFGKTDSRVVLEYKSKGEYEAEVVIGGDTLVFHMHTNVFQFDSSNSLWKTSYLKEDETRGYCGIISVYNFLSDSFRYNRYNDLGYMIARIFVNSEKHFFVQGKRQLGFLYNDFVNGVIDKDQLKSIIHSAILYTLDFDLYTPPYDHVKEITVSQIEEMAQTDRLKTGKRLGFRFQADSEEI